MMIDYVKLLSSDWPPEVPVRTEQQIKYNLEVQTKARNERLNREWRAKRRQEDTYQSLQHEAWLDENGVIS